MFILILLISLGSGTLTRTTPLSISSATSAHPPDDPLMPLSPFSRDVSPCVCPSSQRSIWDIIWSCLATIFLCSWVSVHPDIPGYGEQWWRRFLRRVDYMVWAVLTPELIIGWAFRQWVGARKIEREQKEHGWTVTHGHFMQMGGFMLFKGKERLGTLSYNRFETLLGLGQIEFPNITQEEIEDKSKSDGLSKILVVGQTGWFILQCIVRVVQRLPLTELELATLALAVLNGVMRFFWWNKPFGVESPVPVYLISSTLAVPTKDITVKPTATMCTHPTFHILSGWEQLFAWPWAFILFVRSRLLGLAEDELKFRAFDDRDLRAERDLPGPMHVPIFYSLRYSAYRALIGVFFSGFFYGAIHCTAWDFHFPTLAELWLWRISAVIITAIPVSLLLLGLLVRFFHPQGMFKTPTAIMILLGLGMYVGARFIILAESISTLRDLPPGAFDVVQWTSFVPHI